VHRLSEVPEFRDASAPVVLGNLCRVAHTLDNCLLFLAIAGNLSARNPQRILPHVTDIALRTVTVVLTESLQQSVSLS
jgi:hypothetical protein